jgi:hypothetical protein
MKVHSLNGAIASVEFTREEVLIVNNALNEVCNGIDLEGEFDTRMGCSVEEARNILHAIHKLGSDMKTQQR